LSKKNIIVVGDSFCSSALHWPTTLAELLDLNLLCYTDGSGQGWWDARSWIMNLDPEQIDLAQVIVFVHTTGDRIPTDNKDLGKIDQSVPAVTEQQQAVQLYFRHIHHLPFLQWAQQQWFAEISRVFGHKQLVHLHSFPWSVPYSDLLTGLNITPDLASLSLNELGAHRIELFGDQRPNHFNDYNNLVLARQLYRLIKKNAQGNHKLNISEFHQATRKWLQPW
jgi:hypothetical protein